jgi:hypothetical protein
VNIDCGRVRSHCLKCIAAQAGSTARATAVFESLLLQRWWRATAATSDGMPPTRRGQQRWDAALHVAGEPVFMNTGGATLPQAPSEFLISSLARERPSWRVFFSTLWPPLLAAADQYGNLNCFDCYRLSIESMIESREMNENGSKITESRPSAGMSIITSQVRYPCLTMHLARVRSTRSHPVVNPCQMDS